MKTDIWMPIYIGDYLKDTRHLNTEEHGAYFLILIELWNKNGKTKKIILPRIALKTDKEFFDNIWPQIEEFFLVEESGLVTQKRLSLELKSSIKRRKAAKNNGKKGGRPKTQTKPRGLPEANPGETSSSSSSSSHKPKDKTFYQDSIEYRLADLLFNEILKNNPEHKKPNLQTWAKNIDIMIRVHKRDPQKIANMIAWCQKDDFWKCNILSTAKLKDQYDTLIPKMKNGNNSQDEDWGKYK